MPQMVNLTVETKDDGYHFTVSLQKGYDDDVGVVPYETLRKASAAAGDYTGVMYGLYAFGDGKPCTEAAEHDIIMLVNNPS